MMLIRTYFVSILALTSMYIIHAEHLIILTFRPYPIVEEPQSAEQFTNNLRKPGKSAYNTLRSFLEGGDVVSGIFCTYGGFIGISDRYGQVLFPKLQTKPRFYLLITTRIVPIVLKAHTLHHWEIERRTPAQLFVVDQKKDPQTDVTFWDVYEADVASTFAYKREIPIETIVIFAHPDNIYIPTGITVEGSTVSPHTILPPVYVRKGVHKIENALYVLNLKYFFRKLHPLHQLYPSGYSSLLKYP